MQRRWTVLLALMAIGLVIMAWYPRVPDLASLTTERAVRIRTEWASHTVTRSLFHTETGLTVSLICGGKSSRCIRFDPRTQPRNDEQVVLWHDGLEVYQLQTTQKMLVPYEENFSGRGFLLLIAVLLSLAVLIRIGMHTGLINVGQPDPRSADLNKRNI